MAVDDELEEVAADVWALIRGELEAQHRLGAHPRPVPECASCRSRIA